MFAPQQIQQFQTLVSDAKQIAVCGHIDPDGDCIGACLGMWTRLEAQGKQVRYFLPNEPSDAFAFLPKMNIFQINISSTYTPDLRISLDTAERHRSNLLARNTEQPILHIDHHPTDQGRGDVNFVNTTTNSTCELVLFLLEQTGKQRITPEIATYLFLGLSTDTGHFMRGQDLEGGFGAAQRLVSYGADHQTIIEHIYRSNSFAGVQFTGRLLDRMQYDGQIIRTRFSAAELTQKNLDEAKIEMLLFVMTSISHDGIFLLFKGYDNEEVPYLKCSLRTKNSRIDVGKLAKLFGGGGHAAAAGCRVLLEGKSVTEMMESMKIVFSTSLEK